MHRYRHDERHLYEPPPCPVCGGPTEVNWIDVTTEEEEPDTYAIPGTYWCARDCQAAGAETVERVVSVDSAFEESRAADA